MKILAFGASNSSTSINKEFAAYVSSLVPNSTVNLIDLNDFELPLYSIDREKSQGFLPPVHNFLNAIGEADLIVLSLAEHNGAYSASFKNLLDWASRASKAVFQNKNMVLLSTSPGGRGGKNVMDIALPAFPRMGAVIKGSFSFPSFHQNYEKGKGITNPELLEQLKQVVATALV